MRTLSRATPKSYSLFPISSDPFFMGDFFDDLYRSVFRPQRMINNTHYEVNENENALNLKVYFPVEGIDKEKLTVEYEDGTIMVSYKEIKESKENTEKTNIPSKFYFSYGIKSDQYDIDGENVEAKVNGNILNISLPKTKTIQKRITVQ